LLENFDEHSEELNKLKELLNTKHVEILEVRKSNQTEREKLKSLDSQLKDKINELSAANTNLQLTRRQSDITMKEYKKLKDLSIQSINNYDKLKKEYTNYKENKSTEISQLKESNKDLTRLIAEQKFEIEVLSNDNETKTFQISNLEEKLTKYAAAIDDFEQTKLKDRQS